MGVHGKPVALFPVEVIRRCYGHREQHKADSVAASRWKRSSSFNGKLVVDRETAAAMITTSASAFKV